MVGYECHCEECAFPYGESGACGKRIFLVRTANGRRTKEGQSAGIGRKRQPHQKVGRERYVRSCDCSGGK